MQRAQVRIFAEICRRDLERIVANRKTGVYREDRQDWLKVKNPTYSQAQGRHDLFRGVSVHRKFSSAPVSNLWKYGSSVAFILTVATLLSFGNKPNSRNDPLSVLEAAVVFGFWFAVIASVRWIWLNWPKGRRR
jgi:hypothetical protein